MKLEFYVLERLVGVVVKVASNSSTTTLVIYFSHKILTQKNPDYPKLELTGMA